MEEKDLLEKQLSDTEDAVEEFQVRTVYNVLFSLQTSPLLFFVGKFFASSQLHSVFFNALGKIWIFLDHHPFFFFFKLFNYPPLGSPFLSKQWVAKLPCFSTLFLLPLPISLKLCRTGSQGRRYPNMGEENFFPGVNPSEFEGGNAFCLCPF